MAGVKNNNLKSATNSFGSNIFLSAPPFGDYFAITVTLYGWLCPTSPYPVKALQGLYAVVDPQSRFLSRLRVQKGLDMIGCPCRCSAHSVWLSLSTWRARW